MGRYCYFCGFKHFEEFRLKCNCDTEGICYICASVINFSKRKHNRKCENGHPIEIIGEESDEEYNYYTGNYGFCGHEYQFKTEN